MLRLPSRALSLLISITLAALLATPGQAADREAAQFGPCAGSHRVTCVVDGDTFWYHGDKIRIADINAPEVSKPGCAREARLGTEATARLQALLNRGRFTLAANRDGTGRDRDRYGRLLRTVTRDGSSVGEQLVREGLAEDWKGYRAEAGADGFPGPLSARKAPAASGRASSARHPRPIGG